MSYLMSTKYKSSTLQPSLIRRDVTLKLGSARRSSALAALAQADKAQIVPRYLEMKTPPYQFFQPFQLAVFEILRFAAAVTNQMVMMAAVFVGQLVAVTFLDMIDFSEHTQATKQLDRAVHGGQIDVTIRQLFTDGSGRQRLIIIQECFQNLAPRLRLAVPFGNQRLLDDF